MRELLLSVSPHLLGAFDLSIAATFPQRAIADAIRAQIQNLAADGTMERILALHPGLEGSVPAVASAASISYLPHFAALAIVTAAAMALYAFHQRRERLQALALARSSNVAKEQFLATVSHEIRTPMNAVLGYLDLLEDTQLTSEQKHLAADISRATTSLLTLISNILDFSRIRSGHFELARRPVDLVSLMQDVASSTVLMAEAKDLELAVCIDPSAPRTLLGDEGRLRQVLLNLCANAVKFTSAGYVRIDAHYRDGHLILAVRDTGAGIPSNKLDRVFEPFVQVDSTDTRPHEGVGLGLAIVRDLVRLMHGVISVESTDRIGSQFTIRIPLAAESPEGWITPSRLGQSTSAVLLLRESANASILRDYLRFAGVETHEFREESDASAWLRKNGPTSAQALLLFADPRLLSMPELFARDVRTMGWNRGKRLILAGPISALRLLTQRSREPFHGALEWPISVAALLHMLLPAETTIVAEPPPAPLPGGLTLVVDDNPINRKIAGALLRKLGCRVDVAADGQTAVEMCRHAHYQLILMDCQMPVMDGYATANLIRRQLAPRATTRIIGVSASTEDETRARCIEAGMDGYLPKPLTVASLRRLLDGLAASDAKASL
ncbi:MAG: response regulator [Bryobacterales bacterium]|nr:response regulator [Bryobacterales bacterium]